MSEIAQEFGLVFLLSWSFCLIRRDLIYFYFYFKHRTGVYWLWKAYSGVNVPWIVIRSRQLGDCSRSPTSLYVPPMCGPYFKCLGLIFGNIHRVVLLSRIIQLFPWYLKPKGLSSPFWLLISSRTMEKPEYSPPERKTIVSDSFWKTQGLTGHLDFCSPVWFFSGVYVFYPLHPTDCLWLLRCKWGFYPSNPEETDSVLYRIERQIRV